MPTTGRETSPSAARIVAWCLDALPGSSAPRGRVGAQGSHERALHMNTIVSPIPTKVYRPATVMPRQTSAMRLSGWALISLSGTALPLGYFPTRNRPRGRWGIVPVPRYKSVQTRKWELHEVATAARHRAPAMSATCLNRPPCFSRRRPLCAHYGLNSDIEVGPKTFTEAEVAIAQAAAILLAWESSILISATGRARLNK
jgi:hypothetical protein